MNENVRANIGVDFDGVKGVLTDVVISQRQVNLAWDDGFSFLWVETNIQVGVFEDVNRLVGLDFAKVHVADTDADATLVLTALGIVIRRGVIVQGLAAVRLVKSTGCIRVGQAHGIRSGDARK